MSELKELRLSNTNLILNNNIVPGGILPEKIDQLPRTVTIQKDSVIDGPTYAAKLSIEDGNVEFKGSVFTRHEFHISQGCTGKVMFQKAVASALSIASRGTKVDLTFCSDVNSKYVALANAFVCGCIYADEVELENCVVIGGVFATNSIVMKNCIVGTFNAPIVSVDGQLSLLLPTAFSQQQMVTTANVRMYNLALADLGNLFKGNAQDPESGRILMSTIADEVKVNLSDSETSQTLYSYTVVGKVLAADMIDADKFQNHFLLSAAALGTQLLNVYSLGDKQLSIEMIREFFFNILSGKIEIQTLNSTFSIAEMMKD